jgi:hypothetical protein
VIKQYPIRTSSLEIICEHSLTKYLGGHGNSIGGVIVDSEDGTYTVKERCYPKSAVRHNMGNAKISKSVMAPGRLPTDSQKIALILSSINFRKQRGRDIR